MSSNETSGNRRVGWGHAETIGAALELVARTGDLAFGPRIAARRLIELGALVEIPVDGWNVSEPIFLLCNAERVLDRVRRSLRDALLDAPELR